VKQSAEPIFNVPPIVLATAGALVFVHAARILFLSPEQDLDFLLEFAFIPARYGGDLVGRLPGSPGAEIWTFVTYALIHANLLHLGINVAWLLPFGSAIARRFGPLRFLGLLAVTSAAGAGAQLIGHWGEAESMVGASGAISGLMGAAVRFVFQRNGPLAFFDPHHLDAYRVPAKPLVAALSEPRVVTFLLVWFGINLAVGIGTMSMPGVEQSVAWEAHIGGLVAGLLLFPLFDPVVPSAATGE
jgi:membrane associated rhomboid family serine protease